MSPLLKTIVLSKLARRKKIQYFFKDIPKTAKILEIGCGSGWLGKHLKKNGWKYYIGLDTMPPADIIGNIFKWKTLGIKKNSFDVIVAFEIVEHTSFNVFKIFRDILKKRGKLMLSSPIPHLDNVCLWFERIGLNQPRTSEHNSLIYFTDIPDYFEPIEIKRMGAITQWGLFYKK